MKVSYKLILLFWTGMAKHSQKFQNSKFAMYLQYLEKEVRDEVHFLHAQIFCRLALLILMEVARPLLKVLKIGS